MHIEERNPVAFTKRGAGHVRELAASLLQCAGRHVTGDDGIRDATQPAVPEMHVRAADLGERGFEERASNRRIGLGELADFDTGPRRGHDSCDYGRHAGFDSGIQRPPPRPPLPALR